MNRITISGRVIAEPEIKFFENGGNQTKVKISVKRGNGKKDANGYPESDIFEVEIPGKRGEQAVEWVKAGSYISAFGRFEPREYNGKTYLTVKFADWDFEGPPQKRETTEEGGF